MNEKIKSAALRREESNKKIKERGIAYLETLPVIEESNQVKLKSLDDICKRAIACLLSIQLSFSISQNKNYNRSKELYTKLLKHFNVQNNLLPKEKKIFEGNYQKQDVIDVIWTYETYWALVWALGLIADIEYPYDICDAEKAVKLLTNTQNYSQFKNKCHLRDIEEILDMLDLYYRYNWAITEKSIREETEVGKLDPDVVIERRRGLEWLISEENDWNNISLDT